MLACLPPYAAAAGVVVNHGSATDVTVTLVPDAADRGRTVDVWIGALYQGQLYLRDGRDWKPYQSGALPVALRSQMLLRAMPLKVVEQLDISAFVGAELYVGYGSSEQEMLTAAGKLTKVYTVPSTHASPAAEFRITEMWSDQFPSIRLNGISADQYSIGTASKDGRYILMGASADNAARFAVGIQASGDTSGALVQLAVVVQDQLVPVGKARALTNGLQNLAVDLSRDLPGGARVDQPLDFYVLVGFDKNGDHLLDLASDEVSEVSSLRFRVISKQTHQATFAATALIPGGTKAGNFYGAFRNGTDLPADYVATPGFVSLAELDTKWKSIQDEYKNGFEYGGAGQTCDGGPYLGSSEFDEFSHRVGILPDPAGAHRVRSFAIPAPSGSRPSPVSKDVTDSSTFKLRIRDRLLDAFVASDLVGLPRPASHRLRVAERFCGDDDLYYTFGTAYFDVTLTARLVCTSGGLINATNVSVLGRMWDLYDWNFDGDGPIGNLLGGINRQAAMLQAGYGTLGLGEQGGVYQVDMALSASYPDSDFANRTLGSCAQPVVMLTASPSTATANQSITLNWTVTNGASACTASGNWQGSKATTGGQEAVNVGATPGTRSYVLTCYGPLGPVTTQATVSVISDLDPNDPCAKAPNALLNGSWAQPQGSSSTNLPATIQFVSTDSQSGLVYSSTTVNWEAFDTVGGRYVTLARKPGEPLAYGWSWSEDDAGRPIACDGILIDDGIGRFLVGAFGVAVDACQLTMTRANRSNRYCKQAPSCASVCR